MRRKFFLPLGIVFACTLKVSASDSGAGTTGANFLKIPIAPIPTAMGQAYTAMVGPDSILYNPGSLGLLNYSVISVAHNQYLEKITQEYVSAALRTSLGTFTAAFSTLNSGTINGYDENDARIDDFTTSHMMWAFSYAQSFPHFNQDIGRRDPAFVSQDWTNIKDIAEYHPITTRIAFGATIKQVRERLDDTTASAMSGDIGTAVLFPGHWQIGASVMNISGKQKFSQQSFDLPRTIRAGIATDFISRKNLIVMKVAADGIKESDRDTYYAFGSEITTLEYFQFRIGYRTGQDLGTGLTFGAGLMLDQFTDPGFLIRGLRIDYAYVNQGDLSATHRIGLQFLLP